MNTRPTRKNKPKYLCCCFSCDPFLMLTDISTLALLVLASCHTTNRPYRQCNAGTVTALARRVPRRLGAEILGVNDSLTPSCPTCLHNTRTSASIQSPRVPRAAALVGGLRGLTFKEKEHSNQIILLGFFLRHI